MPVKQILEQQQVEAPQAQLVQPIIYVLQSKAIATPSVKNIIRIKFVNAAPFNVTNFLNGQEGQEIQILGDGQTTLVHDVTKIILLGGVSLLLNVNTVIALTLFGGIWIQH